MTERKGASMTDPVYIRVCKKSHSPDEDFVEIETASGESISIPFKHEGPYRLIGPLYAHPAPAPADHPLFGKMEQLGQQFEKVLHDNLDALQETEQPAKAPAGVPDIAPIAWCVRYDGPPSYDGIHSNPTMHKPEAEALAARAGLVLVELVPVTALAKLQAQVEAYKEIARTQDYDGAMERIKELESRSTWSDTQARVIELQAERIDALTAKLAEAVSLIEQAMVEPGSPYDIHIQAFLKTAREVMG